MEDRFEEIADAPPEEPSRLNVEYNLLDPSEWQDVIALLEELLDDRAGGASGE